MNEGQGLGRREWVLLAALAAVQFLHILDFVIVMPLGPRLMRDMGIGASQFGWVVSAYTFSAAVSGLGAALVMDRYDRRSFLLVLLAGFAVGTLLCAFAPGFWTLVAARVVAGAFGGVMAAVVFAIIGDEVPAERRGMATGVAMAGFSAASVLGLPLGLSLAGRWGWHAPFLLLAGLTVGVAAVVLLGLPAMRGHLAHPRTRGMWAELARVLRDGSHLRAFALTVMLIFAGFTVIPFLSPYLVGNVGMKESELAYIYLAGGLATLVSGPLAGRMSDRFGHARAFTVAALVSTLPILAVTHLPTVGMGVILSVTTAFMVLMNARMVSAMALITGSVTSELRGAFMSVNSALQQAGAGLAASVSGMMVSSAAGGGAIRGFGAVGVVAAVCTLATLPLAWRLAAHQARTAPGPLRDEAVAEAGGVAA